MKKNIFLDLYNYRELIKTSVKKEVRGKYKNSFLGIIWSFLNPLLQISVYAIIFGLIMETEPNYFVFICCGLIPWNFFSTAVNRSTNIIVENGGIIKKIFFPREILPLSICTSEAVNFLISTIIILCFVLFSGIGLSIYVVFYPLILFIEYILLIGISLILSSITVYIRDLQHFVGVVMQLFFYATPIVYASSKLEGAASWITKLNPMAYIVNGFRDIFYYQKMPDINGLGIILVVAIIQVVVGHMIFDKLQKNFAEQL